MTPFSSTRGTNRFSPCCSGLFGGLDLGGDADVAGAQMAAAAGGAADDDHGHGAEADPVGAEQHQLDDVAAGPGAAVRPQLHPVAHPRLHQRPVRLAHADLGGEPHELDGMLARRPGAAVIAADGDDVGPCLGDAEGDGGDSRHRRDLDRDARRRDWRCAVPR